MDCGDWGLGRNILCFTGELSGTAQNEYDGRCD